MPREFLVARAVLRDDGWVAGAGKIPRLRDEEGVKDILHSLLVVVEVGGGFGEVSVEPGAGSESFGQRGGIVRGAGEKTRIVSAQGLAVTLDHGVYDCGELDLAN